MKAIGCALVALALLPAGALAQAPPVIESEWATNISASDATLNATIDSEQRPLAYEFEIDTNASYGFARYGCPPSEALAEASCEDVLAGEELPPGLLEPDIQLAPERPGPQSVSVELAGIGARLAPATTYHFRVSAYNGLSAVDRATGRDQTFTTPAAPAPLIESESARNITASDATLEATLDPQGLYTAYEFQIDTNASYDFSRPACPFEVPGYAQCQLVIAGEALPPALLEPPPSALPEPLRVESVGVDLAGIGASLQPDTTYHYRVIASNGAREAQGADETFTTSARSEAPLLADVAQSRRVWREAGRGGPTARAIRAPLGTSFSFSLSEPAAVTLSFSRQGPRARLRCAPRSAPRKRCELSFSGHDGTNRVLFEGRLAGSEMLPSGSYELAITAANAAGSSAPAALHFTIAA